MGTPGSNHRIYRPFANGLIPSQEWVFDCQHCGGITWHQSRADAFAFGCDNGACRGHGIQHMPRCSACDRIDSDCNCATTSFAVINTI